MKKQAKKAMNRYKRDLKKVFRAFLWAIPFMFVVCVIFPFFDVNIPSWLIIIISMLVGGLLTFLFYVIFEHRARKQQEEREKSGKIDTFSD